MPHHCQVQVIDESGKTFTYSDGNGGQIEAPETHYCKNPPRYVCDSGFKYCKSHKKAHGDKGDIHSFTKLNGGK